MLSTSEGSTIDGSSNSIRRSSDVCDTTDAMFHQSSHGKIALCEHQTETHIFSKAVSGPLQQRTTVLNADLRDASTFPSDYDTDLESEWSKFSKIVFSLLISVPRHSFQISTGGMISRQ